MGRSEARISVDIWAEGSDFRDLSPDAQWMYWFLLSQPDLAHTGVLPLRERRWARCAAGLTAGDISRRLSELAERRFVVVDEDTEEVLVRSLIRRDKVYRQPNVLRNAIGQLGEVVSQRILVELAVEMRRVAGEQMPDSCRVVVEEMRAALPVPPEDFPPNPSGNPSPNPSPNPSGKGLRGVSGGFSEGSADPSADSGTADVTDTTDAEAGSDERQPDEEPSADASPAQNPSRKGSRNPSDNPSGNPSGKGSRGSGKGTEVHNGFPEPRSPSRSASGGAAADAAPATATPTEPAPAEPQPPAAETAQTLIGEWIDHCRERPPKQVIGQTSKQVKTLLDEGISYAAVRQGLAQWHTKGLHPSALPSVVNEVLNARPAAARNGAKPSTTDQRVQAGLDLVQKFAQLDAQAEQQQHTKEIEP